MREVGFDAVQAASPGWLVEVAALLTNAGNYETVAITALIVWFAFERDRAPWLPAIVISGLVYVSAVKNGLALPRPPDAGIGGYGFPSGHGFAATVCYGELARRLDVGSKRARYTAAGLLILAIGASRVVIGVHYPADVLAGMVLGGLWLSFAQVVERAGRVVATRAAVAAA